MTAIESIPHNYSNEIVQTVREPLLVLDADLRVIVASPSFYRVFNTSLEHTIGQRIYELGNGQWDIPALRNLLDRLLPGNGHFDDYEVVHTFPDIGRRTMLLNARRLHDGPDTPPLILLAIEDTTDRRRAEIEIARQKVWFQTTLSSIGDAVIATDPNARVIYLNPIAETMTGWQMREAQGKPVHEVFNIVNEESRKLVESPVSKAIRLGGIVGLANHTVLIAKDGTERPIDDSAAPIRDEEGRITGVVMVFHDIADRRAAERLLAQSEDQYRTLFNSSEEGFCVIDVIFDDRGNAEDYRFLATNPAFEKQTGLSSSVGKRIRELAPDQDVRWFELYGKVALTGKAIRFINEGKLPGDPTFDIYAFRLGGAESRRVGLLFADISDRRHAEQSLKSSELRYRRLFEAAHDGILLVHAETHLINDVNPFLLKLLEQPREYFIGRALWQIGIFSDAAANELAMQELHARGSWRFKEVDLKDSNGRLHPVEIVANLYHEDGHRVIQCNLRDVSERKRAEHERQAMLANEQSLRIEAEAANRAKDTFLATLFGYSHMLGGFAGGQAQYARVPFADFGAFAVPDGVTDEQALFLTDIFPTGYMAAENAQIEPGDTVAVWGCGPVGQFTIQSCWMFRAGRVIAIDTVPERLRMAETKGKAETIDFMKDDVYDRLMAMTDGHGPSRCIDAVGTEAHGMASFDSMVDKAKAALYLATDRPHVIRQAVHCCGKGGTVSVPGVYMGMIDKFPMGSFVGKGLTMKSGQTHVHRYLKPLMSKIVEGEIDPSFVITHRIPLSEAPSAYKTFRDKQDGCIKVVLKPN